MSTALTRRDRLRAIAEENVKIFDLGLLEATDGCVVDISTALQDARSGSRVISAPVPARDGSPTDSTRVTLSDETTVSTLHRLNASGCRNIVVLNFASGTTPGGGYLRGGSAQEEALCRATSLHPALVAQAAFYQRNKDAGDAIYHDDLIMTPSLTVFRDDWHQLTSSPFLCNVLTCPAPNRAALDATSSGKHAIERADRALMTRIGLILDTAASLKPDVTILGAWGCGDFGNDPELVAQLFHRALRARLALSHVHFAIPDLEGSNVGRAFRAHLGTCGLI